MRLIMFGVSPVAQQKQFSQRYLAERNRDEVTNLFYQDRRETLKVSKDIHS